MGADRRTQPAWVGAGPILARMEETLDAKPAHYRLSRATWEIILEAYRNGATVPELSERWRVSQHALRKRITVHGATKRDWGDARAREQAEARERMQAERAAAEAVRAEALFAPSEGDADETAEVLAETAMRASARAMRGRMWDEARALAQLAEAYGRMAQRSERARGRGEVTLDDIPLELIKALALNEDQCASSRLAIWDEADPHPAKQEYWAVNAAQREAGMEEWLALMRERKTLRDRVRELEAAAGLAPRSDQAQAGRAEDEELSI
ncbi:hypothetical protein BDI01nite_22800 [Brevundimonas diminuta]|nr:hypothetical protein BDI01nite_22800 [Brevundimonas diminuta]